MLSSLYQFWNSYGSDFQNGAVVLSAIAAFLVIRDARATAKRRATLDLILHQESDTDLIEERVNFNQIKSAEIKVETYAADDKRNSDQFSSIRKILNLHELTAVAISEGVIDERVYRRWFNGTYIKDFEATRRFIEVARVTYDNPRSFCEFERTARRWKADPHWDAPPNWWARKWAAFVAVFKA